MVTLIDGCRKTTEFLTKHGLLFPCERAGRYRPRIVNSRPLLQPEQMEALQKAQLHGALYRSQGHWQMHYEVVCSFLRKRREGTACIFDEVFDDLAAPLQDVADVLPSVMAIQNFQLVNTAKNGRQFFFRAAEECTVEDLPEPYGNWLQHRQYQAKWQKKEELEVSLLIKLSSPRSGITRMRIEASTFAISTVVRLGWGLNEELSLQPKAAVSFNYLRNRVRFLIGGREVNLSSLV